MKNDFYPRQLFSNLKGRGETVSIVGKVVKIFAEDRRLLLECDPESILHIFNLDKSIATVLILEDYPLE
jgi:hypothetical protein